MMGVMICWARRASFRKLGYAILFIFFCNLILIARIVDWQLAVELITRGNIKWSDNRRTEELQSTPVLSSCDLSGPLITSALSRMQTEECRTAARDIVCNVNRLTPDTLPNSCPKYEDELRGQYVGCYEDSPNTRVLTDHLYKFKSSNSPSYCVNMCLRAGYSFAGIEYRDECFCGDVLAQATALPATSCEQYRCENESLFCGGYNAIAVYRTGVLEKPLLIINYSEPDSELPNVQILFLLQLNGRNTRQVNRLLRIIYSPKHYYIIHVDSRQEFMFEEMKALVVAIQSAGFENVYLMERRYATIWAGATLLSMVLDVLRTALHFLQWTTWDFMLNLSESDFPILSMAELESHLARNKGRTFLSTHGYDTARFIQKQGLEYVFMQCENRMWRLMKRTKFPSSIRLDGGSDWVVISRDFAQFALSDEELPRNLRQFFANILLPVESFFHTLAANSKFCVQTVKGNLRLTNWKRRQGCRCAMLRKIVDWCGCSPLVLRSSDAVKFTVDGAQSRVVFFGRKFDPMISQQAIAIAEAQALRFSGGISGSEHPSFNKSWINIYSSRLDKSVLLESVARKLYQRNGSCAVDDLLSITAYKENDVSPVKNIYKLSSTCDGMSEFIQVLVESNNPTNFLDRVVDGYELQSLEIGSDFDLKEEVFRKYHGVFSEEDTIYAKLVWRRIESLPTSVSRNCTSPEVIAEWKNSRGVVMKRATIQPHDSIYGGQCAELFSNETAPGEWTIEFVHKEGGENTVIASTKFVIFPVNERNINVNIASKYLHWTDVCSETNSAHFRNCLETPWSPSFPDPKSRLFL